MRMKWSEAVTLEFVKIYLEHEVLWNPDHDYYKSRSQRDCAYANICSRFNESTSKALAIPDVKMKIRNLRTTYQQQIQKILQKSSPDHIYQPTLVWFNEMDRCLKNISSRHLSLPMTQEISEADSSSYIFVTGDVEKTNEKPHVDPLFPQSDHEHYDESKSECVSTSKEINSSHKKVKKKKIRKHNLDVISSTSNITKSEDEFDIYGNYIAAQLRKMNLRRALRLQLQIQRILSNARISNLKIC